MVEVFFFFVRDHRDFFLRLVFPTTWTERRFSRFPELEIACRRHQRLQRTRLDVAAEIVSGRKDADR